MTRRRSSGPSWPSNLSCCSSPRSMAARSARSLGGDDGHQGWVYSLAVGPDVRRRGIGTALMWHIERELVSRGCPKVNLQFLGSNAATVAFYQKLGYSVEERVSMG